MKQKTLIPLIAAGFILFFSLVVLLISQTFIKDEVRRQQTVNLKHKLHGLQTSTELFLSLDRVDGVEQVFSAMASDSDHEITLLTDSQGIVIASTDYSLVGESYLNSPYQINASTLEELATSRGLLVEIINGKKIAGYASVCGVSPVFSLRPQTCGFLFHRGHLEIHYAEKSKMLFNQAIGMVVGGVLCGLLFWLFINKRLTSRLDYLEYKMNKFANGERSITCKSAGNDEIGAFANGLNRLFQKVTEDENDLAQAKALRSAILDNATVAIISTDTKGVITSFNRTAQWMLGYSKEKVENKETPALFHDPKEVLQAASNLSEEFQEPIEPGFEVFVHRVKAGANFDEQEWTYISNVGTRIPVRLTVSAIYSEDLSIVGYLGFAEDITLKKQHEESLLLAEKVFRNAGEAIIVTDENSVIIDVNPAYCEISGFAYDEVIGQDPGISSSGRHDKAFYTAMWKEVLDTGLWSGEVWDRRKNGEVYPKHLTITAVKNDDGRVLNYVGTFKDVTAQKELEDKLENLAYFDPLTKLPNRALFRDRLEQELKLAKRHKKVSALMFIDLDRFKIVNDTLGHEAGDRLLIEVGERLCKSVRDSDTVSRLGGDEFTVILTDITDQAYVGTIANQIIESLQKAVLIDDKEAYVGASIGISLFPADGADSVQLIKNADTAMYRAKDAGRGNFKFFSQDMEEINLRRSQIENHLRHAVENKELQLYYQPKYSFADNKITGYEALIRWNSKELGFVMPDRFIPLAEENGLILEIGEWVLLEACRQMSEWIDQGLQAAIVAVNLSPKQFRDPDLISKIQRCLEERNLSPNHLELEITETAMMDNAEESVRIIEQISALGVKIAMDDFGTGYSSLAYLQKFPFDTLKIDLSFIKALENDPSAEVIVKTILKLAEGLGISTVAEGVETDKQQKFLRALNCDIAQGYFYGKPMPASEVLIE